MILLRELQENDLEELEKLAQIPGFINLTADKDALREKLNRSVESFCDTLENKSEAKFVFVAEDLETKKVLGTSMVAAQHGNEESPHFFFEVASEKKFSATINTGFIHGTLKLKYDINGPSEIGGLVVDPGFRDSPIKVGRQISFVRFLFLGTNKSKFKKKLLAELLPPLNKKGQSPLWEAIGRRFTNMDYWEADQLCQKNKEFIFSLFPSGKIYTTFLPAEARNSIGKVGKDTEAVVYMLKKIGFEYKNQVDPFDGGPHLWANVDHLVPIRNIAIGAVAFGSVESSGEVISTGLLSKAQQNAGQFRAVEVKAVTKAGQITLASLTQDQLRTVLGLSSGDSVVFMPYY
ncbi:MAG: arginine N-succinyltransferase [Bdellovibrionota bacterium]